MNRILSGLALAAVVSAGCTSPFTDDSAATVDGVEISVDEVAALAAAPEVVSQAQSVEGLIDAPDDQLGGGSARVALGFLIQTELLASATRRAGLDVPITDTSGGSQGELSAEVLAVQDRFSAYGRALASVQPDTDALDAFLVAQNDFLDAGVCIEGVGVPPDSADEFGRTLADGITFDELAAELGDQLRFFGTESSPACVELSELPDKDLEALLERGEIGTIGRVELTAADGSTEVLFVRPVSRGDERVAEVERVWASTVFGDQNSAIPAWLAAMTELVDVDVDSRFGELAVGQQVEVVPPVRPSLGQTADDLLGV